MDQDTVLKVAKLSKLKLTKEEIELYSQQFGNILDSMKKLEKAALTDEAPYMTTPNNNLREDVINSGSILDKKTALGLATHHDDNYFIVPKVSKKDQ